MMHHHPIIWTHQELIAYCVAGFSVTIVPWIGLHLWAHGDWRPPWRRLSHLVIFGLFVVIGSQSQTYPAWAQEQQRKNDQRLENLETRTQELRNNVDVHEAVAKEAKKTADRERQANDGRITNLESRVKDNERFRDRIEWSAPLLATASSFMLLLLWEVVKARPWRRMNGRNGHTNGGTGK
jgi:hypothetical protein